MSDTVTESEDRVPGLGAIPIIGNLFKSRSGSRQKKNLVVFIRPRIMRDADATESTSEAKYNEVRRSQQNITGGHITLLPGEKQPVIPAIPVGIALPAAPPPDTNAQGATAPQFTVPPPANSQPDPATPPPATREPTTRPP
jgi:general secretion pathway protein D